jgi:uncharacterized protein YukE
MANFTGMDIQQVRNLSTQMNTKAGEIRTIMQTLTTALDNTPWVGPDQVQFVGDWKSQHCSQLNSVITALEDAGRRAATNADQQEQASA